MDPIRKKTRRWTYSAVSLLIKINQIQIIQEDVHATTTNDLNTQNDQAFDYSPNTGSSRNKFVLKFTEQSLRE